MTRTIPPKLFGGRLCLKCALTTPELPREISCQRLYYSQFFLHPPIYSLASSRSLPFHNYRSPSLPMNGCFGYVLPCGLATLPQMTRILVPRISFLPRYTYAILLPR